MFAVTVTFKIKEGEMSDFLPLMENNARLSLERERGCHRFDVCTDPGRENEVFLYEVYSDRTAFDLHLTSEHFLSFDKEVSEMIASKSVATFERVVP
ncbi:antibiotic biosynthesis monooxygenase [Roseibium polysiphoniae]|uniref:Antibiotic biosynthesis monooxygenase n=1 Tax=Roseibium polysiphoniae TaxID=2571221 RepID=A0A944CEX8_9HYPH|nr:antibiotic biosynthesis monooxygenase [Roseibium polysiphoniae]